MLKLAGAIAILVLLLTPPQAPAHNVWCHGTCGDPKITVEFYHRAGDVYIKLSRLEKIWQEANSHLESGVIAEFESKLNAGSRPNAGEFRLAYDGYVQLQKELAEFDQAIVALQAVDSKCEKVKANANALRKVLEEGTPLPRLSRSGVRYSDAAGLSKDRGQPITDTTTILAAWRTDLQVLSKTLDEVVAGLRDALPLAEKGEFAAVMLSGRNAFGDKMPQLTDMFSAYQRLYVQTVMATITATMQAYPAGYEWLTKPAGKSK